ncbi:pyrroline-5-carboxylate reductase, partial [bacterium]|nr:pyrroline-5-carboxylate reductase [bacterium]
MNIGSVGFIGGGRITRIILTALENAGGLPGTVIASDASAEVIERLKKSFPSIVAAGNDNAQPASCDLVFVSLHPPVLADTLHQIKSLIRPEAVVVSLAPKITLSKLTVLLDRHARIVRMIPNAPSVITKGYNPVAFSRGMPKDEKSALLKLFGLLGDSPEVPEEHLEAYAIIAAMGPTYFWFQWQALAELAQSFGLTGPAAGEAVAKMVNGAVDTMFA